MRQKEATLSMMICLLIRISKGQSRRTDVSKKHLGFLSPDGIQQAVDCRVLCRDAEQLVSDAGEELPLLCQVAGHCLRLPHDVVHLRVGPTRKP